MKRHSREWHSAHTAWCFGFRGISTFWTSFRMSNVSARQLSSHTTAWCVGVRDIFAFEFHLAHPTFASYASTHLNESNWIMERYSDCDLGLGTLRHFHSIFMKARPAAQLPKIGSSAPVQTLVRGTRKTFGFHHTDVFEFQCKDILGSSAT